jgi:serine/threonine protein kinase
MAAAPYATRAEHVQHLFDAVIDLTPEGRAAHLALACAGDSGLLREIDSLVEAFATRAGYVRAVLHQVAPDQPSTIDGADVDRLLYRRVSHYLILEKLGGGGMGVVYKAWDERLERTVALKFLTPRGRRGSLEARLVAEAKAISGLDHPNIAVIHEIGEVEGGQYFIVMTCYGGETLKARISSGPLPTEEALRYATQMAEGLKRAHEAGIIHRDVKPANVIVTERQEVKLLDFGLAKESAGESIQTDAKVGTPAYMSPEQIRGDAVDQRTDIWSLGVVLYEMLAGERPFSAEHEPDLLRAILHEQPEPLSSRRPSIPNGLEAVLRTTLAKDPAERYADMGALLTALYSFQESPGAR